jgi:hypothetical protein
MRSGTESDWLVGATREALDRGAIRRPALDAEIARLDLAAQDRARRLLRHLEERTRAV